MKFAENKNIKRLAIFVFYDKDGVVDKYVTHLLDGFQHHFSDISIVCNGKLTPEGRGKFLKYTDDIFVRDNIGFDTWAYKSTIDRLGWKKINEYDEIVLLNSTIMGPVTTFDDMFEEMNNKDLDFWGITQGNKLKGESLGGRIKYGYIPEHIQSYFIAVRKSMFNTAQFRRYWEKMPKIKDYHDAVGKHEVIFTKQFSDAGFVWDTYINAKNLKEKTDNTLMMMPIEVIRNLKCPIFKRKSFIVDFKEYANQTTGQVAVELFNYLKNETDYDTDMILENIIRTDNLTNIKNALALNYVLPYSIKVNNKPIKHKIALIFHAHFMDLIDDTYYYVNNMPAYADIYITTNTEEKANILKEKFKSNKFNKLEVMLINNRGRDNSSLMVASKDIVFDYDYVCCAHDKKSGHVQPQTIGAAFAYKCLENTLGSEIFIENTIEKFESEPRLGFMSPPPPTHAVYYGTLGNEWGENFQITKEFIKKHKFNVNIDNTLEPVSGLGGMFWFRPKALKPLFDLDWQYSDFPKEPLKLDGTIMHMLERIYGLIGQHSGYFSAFVTSDKFASIEATTSYYMLRRPYNNLNSVNISSPNNPNNGLNITQMMYRVRTRDMIKIFTKFILYKYFRPLFNYLVKVNNRRQNK